MYRSDGAPDRVERSCDVYSATTRLFADGSYAEQKIRGSGRTR